MSAPGSSPCRPALSSESTTKSVTEEAATRKGSASATARRASRLAFQPTSILLPIDLDFQPLGMTRMGESLASRSFSGDA
jgi:hypothetical protein